jgi:hypothetical protein
MHSLIARSDAIHLTRVAVRRQPIDVRTLHVRFGRATPDRLPDGVLPTTYTSKPLVSVGGDAMFGELAVVRVLEQDGWDAVWVDTFHGRRFWRAMPHRSMAVALPTPARARYDAIVAANEGKASGFFDVLAWRDGQFAHLEYKGAGDRANRNEARWIEAALAAGVSPFDLWFVRLRETASDESAD